MGLKMAMTCQPLRSFNLQSVMNEYHKSSSKEKALEKAMTMSNHRDDYEYNGSKSFFESAGVNRTTPFEHCNLESPLKVAKFPMAIYPLIVVR